MQQLRRLLHPRPRNPLHHLPLLRRRLRHRNRRIPPTPPPQALIPFQIEIGQAEQTHQKWLKKEAIQPSHISPITGIYLPMWTFDIGGELKWSGLVRRGDNWEKITGNKLIFFDDILIPASKKLPPSCQAVMSNFDLTQLVPYEDHYLAAWPAERYQLPLADASLQGRKKVLRTLRKQPQTLTKERIRDLGFGTSQVVIESYKLILLPLWINYYTLNNQTFHIVINGQNGRLFSNRPRKPLRNFLSWLRG